MLLFEGTRAHERGIKCVSFGPNGSYAAKVSADNSIRVWNTRTWTSERLKGHEHWVMSVAFSPNGKTIASGSLDDIIRLWDVESTTCVGVSRKWAARYTVYHSLVMGTESYHRVLATFEFGMHIS